MKMSSAVQNYIVFRQAQLRLQQQYNRRLLGGCKLSMTLKTAGGLFEILCALLVTFQTIALYYTIAATSYIVTRVVSYMKNTQRFLEPRPRNVISNNEIVGGSSLAVDPPHPEPHDVASSSWGSCSYHRVDGKMRQVTQKSLNF
jgi:hypothetical protein